MAFRRRRPNSTIAPREFKKLEQVLSHWKRIAKLLQKDKQKLGFRAQTLATQLEEGRVEFQEQLGKASVSPSEQVVVELKRQNKQLRKTAAPCSEAVEQREEQIRRLLEKISRLKSENGIVKQDLQSQRDETVRERQLNEANSKTLALQIRTEFRSKFDDVSAQHEGEPQRVVGLVVKKCPELFDGRQQRTGDCLEAVLEEVIRECRKLKEGDAAIQRLLSISAVESLEDAVAKVSLVQPRTTQLPVKCVFSAILKAIVRCRKCHWTCIWRLEFMRKRRRIVRGV
jgi:myosin heavy subunit